MTITINVRTKQVWNAREHEPQLTGHYGLNITPGYIRGWCEPNYPVPAIIYKVRHYRGKAIDIASYKPSKPFIDRWWEAMP